MPFDLDLFRQDVLADPIVYATWHDKYRWKEADGTPCEQSVAETRERVVRAVYAQDRSQEAFREALELVQGGYLVPAGRVNAGAGLDRAVTLTNCFVNETIQDSMVGIQRVITHTALTMQQGGGDGSDFSTIRPNGALVKRTGSVSSGVIPFMDQMSAMSDTVISAGTRRGAMMATLRCDHPDLWNPEQFETVTKFDGSVVMKNPSFISAKRQRGRLTQFNVSILATEAFMDAVRDDTDWDLGFHVPRADGKHVDVYDKPFPYDVIERDNEGRKIEGDFPKKGQMLLWFVYRRVRARTLWNDIMESTYVYAEPGIIFIDRVNERNNLFYCEEINCTNPCVTGDTLVAVAGRGPVPIRQLAEEGVDIPVFCHSSKENRIVVRWGRQPRLTRTNAELVKVHLDDGTSLTVTPNHEFPVRNGQPTEAKDLPPGTSLFRFDSSVSPKGETVIIGNELQYHLIAEAKYGRKFEWGTRKHQFHAHHIDFNHNNDSWDNIEVLTASDHSSLHRSGDGNPMRWWWSSLSSEEKDQYRATMRGAVSRDKNGMWGRSHSAETLAKIGSRSTARFAEPTFRKKHRDSVVAAMTDDVKKTISLATSSKFNTFEKTCSCGTVFYVRAKSLETGAGKRRFCSQRCAALNASQSLIEISRRSQREKITGRTVIFSDEHRKNLSDAAKRRYRGQSLPVNHKVVRVEVITDRSDVYNITVDDHHNYAVITSAVSSGSGFRGGVKYSGVICSNCGEQPLPEHGTCCLSSVNLAFMVKDPFTENSRFDFDLYRRSIRHGVRFLDNVLTTTKFPLQAQQDESDSKRRIGLGVTGFADALVQLRVVYGSDRSVELSRELSAILQEESYSASSDLAAERGAFPLFNLKEFSQSFNFKKLPDYVQEKIARYGIRNGVLNTVAPNGTISLYTGNVPSGIEPIFSILVAFRKMRQPDGSFKEFEIIDYAQRMFRAMFPGQTMPDYFVGAHDVHPRDHVRVLAAWQEHIDAAISKTINCPEDLPFEEFEALYQQTYDLGCKGCTTYRPDPISGRGSILSEIKETAAPVEDLFKTVAGMNSVAASLRHDFVHPRPEVVPGRTYKIKWPQSGENVYVTVTNDDGRPLEVFIKHADALLTEWTDALSRMITGVLRRGGDVKFIVEQLQQVGSAKGGAFMRGSFHASQVAAIASAIETEFKALGVYTSAPVDDAVAVTSVMDGLINLAKLDQKPPRGAECPACHAFAMIRETGCRHCLDCGHEECG